MLEANITTIATDIVATKAEVGAMQRDVSSVRGIIDNAVTKLDTVVHTVTTIAAQQAMHRPRDPFEIMKTIGGSIVAFGTIVAMTVAGIKYIGEHDAAPQYIAQPPPGYILIPQQEQKQSRR